MQKLEDYFRKREDVSFVYLFGSVVTGNMHSESDIDIGIYFTPETPELEYESEAEYDGEDKIWLDLEKITGRKTDMIVLNRAPSTLFYSVLNTGQKIFARDERLLQRLYLALGPAAEDFREFVNDFVKIKERSNSLSEVDRERILRAASFLDQEILEFEAFEKVSQEEYQNNLPTKRNIERWAENIVNASIDIAKIVLASEKRQIPETYRLILEQLGSIKNFDTNIASDLASYSKMRNLLAHEYLDIRFAQLQKFASQAKPAYVYLSDFVKKFLEN